MASLPGGSVANNRMLKEGGCDLEAAVHRCAAAAGFAAEATLKMLKPRHGDSAAEGEDDEEAAARKFEPIFVFRKPGAPPPAAPEAQAEALDALLDDL